MREGYRISKTVVRIPLYITRYVQWHNRLDAVSVSHEKKAIHLPTLSHLVTTQNTGYFVQVAPSPSHVRTKRDADTLIAANLVRIPSII